MLYGLLVVLAACGSGSPHTPVGSRVAPAMTAAFAGFTEARAPWRCASDGSHLADETIKLGERTWKLTGTTVTVDGGPITIGVIADAGGNAPDTIAALGRLHAKLADADLVIALGGMGATQPELEATLGSLSDKAVVIALAGDLEPVPALAAAIAALRTRGRTVIDGRLARELELPGATIATLPGASAAVRLAAGADGCGYTATNVTAILDRLTTRPQLRVLASAEAPRLGGDEATGQRALSPVAGKPFDVHLHGPVTPDATPARTGGRDGTAVPLSPGTADATTRLPGPKHAPSAGVLAISGGSWKWRPVADE